MQKAHKDLLRSLIGDLCRTLAGTWDEHGTPIRGDLDRELERIGIGPDGSIRALDALPRPTPHEARAHRVAEAQLAPLPQAERPARRAEIAAATQLFTEPYMVKWLLQNSLGRSYAEAYPDSALPATWEYYIDREQILADQDGGAGDPAADAARPLFTLDELTVMDPCMGSGNSCTVAIAFLPDRAARAYTHCVCPGQHAPS